MEIKVKLTTFLRPWLCMLDFVDAGCWSVLTNSIGMQNKGEDLSCMSPDYLLNYIDNTLC